MTGEEDVKREIKYGAPACDWREETVYWGE
jgi:hypothetical protein